MLEKSYYVALRKRDSDRFWEKEEYQFYVFKPKSERYWLADPFLFEREGKTYLFYEAFDRYKNKGVIAYSIIYNCDKISEPCVVIERDYHMSFPNVFEFNGEIYMLPETSQDNSLVVFKSVHFPDRWEEIVLNTDIFTCDSIVIYNAVRIPTGILTSEMYRDPPDGIIPSCYVRNKLYRCRFDPDLKLEGTGEVVAEGDDGVRNGGACFRYRDRQFRVGQECRDGIYGNGLVFFEIQENGTYSERRAWEYHKEELAGHLSISGFELLGTHTYNSSPGWEVLDFSVMYQVPAYFKFIRLWFRGIRFVKKRIRRLVHI